jgi:hypothetical protein
VTSEISSSPRVISCAAGPTVAAGAPLGSDNDNPAAPNKGTAHARCFRFEAFFLSDMVESSHTFGQMFDQSECRKGPA